jgi:hypothetical protein
MASKNSFQTQVAFYFENTIGAVPVDAAAWVTAEGLGDAFRMFVQELSPEFIRGEMAVVNEDMMTRVGEKLQPHHGLPTADGGSMISRMWSTGESFVTGATVVATPLGRLLGHAIGGSSLGNHATVTVINSPTSFDVDDADDLAVGQIIGLRETADPNGYAYPAQIVDLVGVTVTIDRVMPFTLAIGDLLHGAETAYFDQDALTNPANPMYSTLSLLIAKGPDVWVAGGAHLALESLAVERGQQPKFTWPILAAAGYPPGTAGAVTLPAFTGTIEGLTDVRAIGRLTNARLATYGDTTTSILCPLFSAAITPGVPVLAQDSVTECASGSPGRYGYRTEPGDTMLTLVVQLDADKQTLWTAGTYLTVSYYQVGPIGECWCVHGRKAFLMDAPRPVLDQGTNRYEIVVQLTDDVDAAADGELAASKIQIARY